MSKINYNELTLLEVAALAHALMSYDFHNIEPTDEFRETVREMKREASDEYKKKIEEWIDEGNTASRVVSKVRGSKGQ